MTSVECEEEQDIVDWWEAIQPALIKFLQSYSSSLVREKNSTKNFLFAGLKSATSQGQWSRAKYLKEKLLKILKFEAQGVVIRSRYQQNSEEEKASIFTNQKR